MILNDLTYDDFVRIFSVLLLYVLTQILLCVLLAIASIFSYRDSCNRRDFTIMKRRAKRIRKRREYLESKGCICDIYGNKKGEQGS